MPVGEALMVALSGFIVVFIMLCVLWAIINLVNVVTTSIEKKEAAPVNKAEPVEEAVEEEPVAEQHAIYGGEIALYGVDEKTAACIMAIVSDETKIPLDQLIFKSIKAIA